MSSNQYPYRLWQCFLPFFISAFLLLSESFLVGDHGLWKRYYSQIALLTGAVVAGGVAWLSGVSLVGVVGAIKGNMSSLVSTIVFLLLIRMLCVSWLFGGVIPAGIFFGIKYVSPSFFLVVVALFSGVMSLVCGSSWLTVGTMGTVFLGIGKSLGFAEPLVAGAVISGAYFGDKLSPLSETTILASSTTKTDLYRHVAYMMRTSIPSFVIALFMFWVWNVRCCDGVVGDCGEVSGVLDRSFHVRGMFLLIPVVLLVLTVFRVRPYVTLLVGSLLGYWATFVYQESLLLRVGCVEEMSFFAKVQLLMSKTFWGVEDVLVDESVPALNRKLSSDGIWGMCATISIIVTAVVFSGAMEGAGLLDALVGRMRNVRSTGVLMMLTSVAAIFFNATVADQYLAIILTSKMFGKMFARQGLASENLSRAIEDAATVTSPLIKWNTCGAAQSNALGVAVVDYLPYCFFNLISPVVGIVVVWLGIGVRRVKVKEEG